jgi:excinuclease ABC subunit B
VSLITILDADKEGFLRPTRSLIQVIGRAARNANGKVIMYADRITDSMKEAIDETNRRRAIQEAYNFENGIIPTTIIKEIRSPLGNTENSQEIAIKINKHSTRSEIEREIKRLESDMRAAAKAYDFERAAEIRDIVFELKASMN